MVKVYTQYARLTTVPSLSGNRKPQNRNENKRINIRKRARASIKVVSRILLPEYWTETFSYAAQTGFLADHTAERVSDLIFRSARERYFSMRRSERSKLGNMERKPEEKRRDSRQLFSSSVRWTNGIDDENDRPMLVI